MKRKIINNQPYFILDHKDESTYVQNILNQIASDNYQPDIIIGITRGGCSPAIKVSHELDIPTSSFYTWKVSVKGDRSLIDPFPITDEDILKNEKILIVDDINDSGQTLSFVKNAVDHLLIIPEVRYAVLIEKKNTFFKDTHYYGVHFDDLVGNDSDYEKAWAVFTWEKQPK
jgi:hypoxanthine phosphoribosyltransferase